MHNQFDLTGKVALVTGASGGLGRHFAQTLGLAGAKVVVAGRRAESLNALVVDLQQQGVKAHAVVGDVTDESAIRACFDEAQALYGLVNVVVCTAGGTVQKSSLSMSAQDWDQVLDVNLKGCWLVANEAARRLVKAQRPGSIITISSILGYRVAGNVLPYTVSKAGLEQMTRALAFEWARYGIRVNAMAPGYIETDLNREFFASEAGQAMIKRIPQRRLGQVSDLDGALLLLASDASLYMTGSSIVVDGGHLQSTL
ncbi:2-deoxy-D-gluconate 3-dehydrogenase [Pollutimonas nitritireducens]|uniref:2-deoxy-D-gluconate 3-dehydrogenase n=1 Tax=Pollutimonas nitritireducens TaxID=2045209 RepID=A0A2N4UG89_9BURK|nr:SDR family oxidoreductase [Pollutimonas nitritireducens]PLC54020.1 2-deoxy-D-gluconate 3-dehydrogenase [Pollutimonas nitritireducens]